MAGVDAARGLGPKLWRPSNDSGWRTGDAARQRRLRGADRRPALLVHLAVFRRLASPRPRRRRHRRPDARRHRHSLADGDRPPRQLHASDRLASLWSPPRLGLPSSATAGAFRSARIRPSRPSSPARWRCSQRRDRTITPPPRRRSASLVGLILICAGALRLGFVADLLSIPVTTGFLVGIAGHILILQAPAVLGVEPGHGSLAQQALSLIARAQAANPWTLVIGLGVLAIMLAGEALKPAVSRGADWPLPRRTGDDCARSRGARGGDARVASPAQRLVFRCRRSPGTRFASSRRSPCSLRWW